MLVHTPTWVHSLLVCEQRWAIPEAVDMALAPGHDLEHFLRDAHGRVAFDESLVHSGSIVCSGIENSVPDWSGTALTSTENDRTAGKHGRRPARPARTRR